MAASSCPATSVSADSEERSERCPPDAGAIPLPSLSSTAPSSSPPNVPSAVATCRFCLEEVLEPKESEDAAIARDDPLRVVSPCSCRGTAALVHIGCLRRWQVALLSRRLTPESMAQAALCSVCRAPLVVDGAPLEPVVARPARSVHAGMLLVATENLDGEGRSFHRSIILLCQVVPQGRTCGVDISRLLVPAPEGPVRGAIQGLGESTSIQVRTFSGGPVCGGRLGVVQYTVLSTFREEPGNCGVVLAPSAASPGLYGPEPWVNLDARHAANVICRTQSADRHGQGDDQQDWLFLFKGHAAWSRGQLEAEIQRGNWSTCDANFEDILASINMPRQAWHRLQSSGRLARAVVTAGD